MKKNVLFVTCFLFFVVTSFAQTGDFKCYPTNWWVGMKWNKLQLMVHGQNGKHVWADKSTVQIKYPGVKIVNIHKPENRNYIFIDLEIAANTKPGTFKIDFVFIDLNDCFSLNYELKPRRPGNGTLFAQGVTAKDFIYLIMPDRFSNGDESNDRVAGMRDQSLNRDTVFNRHGGDLLGVQNHLDYLYKLGVTTIWLNPVIENDMPNRTEHGYAFTDHYKVDARLGGDKAYQQLIDATHAKGMKMIQDAVYNHVGLYHFTVQDMPMKDWLHQWPAYTNTTYKDQVLFDPYASKKDVKQMEAGWFTPQMPDLNQENPFVANFLIQHALWTVENFGIDGWRIDTYAYNDLAFMNRCNKALMDEYPGLTMFGETWVHGVPNQSYFVQNNYNLPYKSNLQAPTDFQTLWGITDAMTKDFGWTDGVNRLYTTLAQDFVYKDPTRNVIFLDNHDMARFYSVVNQNMDKYKSALSWLLTCRGIPQMYYGDELATTGTTSPNDGYVRLDFPGGWKNDPVNKFTIEGRTQTDQEIFQHLATLANFRKSSSALTTGKMMQYLPDDGLYVYFRYDNEQTIMVVMNTAKVEKKVSIDNYKERTGGFTTFKNVITKETGTLADFNIGSYKTVVYQLIK
ncbi:MAG: glycoside hydrolase family 13 protein [Ferruginibacter sp.]|nr:glycoside hydrolase family 13 protein [Bacteroidota bacterium]MBX2918879.1 glycoside hydrolase family 13 protein [Ferruginibacter sp.]MCC7379282.1 glycoside hydrolase family 13 protein [Chitinophagaceae bacterium]